jgi:D-proline reductase (dithiol) PrdB
MPFIYTDYMTRLMAAKPYPPQPNFDPAHQIRKPIGECTIGVLTSYGAQLKDDHPMAHSNDLSYRLLHRDIPLSELQVSHMTPVRKWALDDLNLAYPRDRLIELEKNGVF